MVTRQYQRAAGSQPGRRFPGREPGGCIPASSADPNQHEVEFFWAPRKGELLADPQGRSDPALLTQIREALETVLRDLQTAKHLEAVLRRAKRTHGLGGILTTFSTPGAHFQGSLRNTFSNLLLKLTRKSDEDLRQGEAVQEKNPDFLASLFLQKPPRGWQTVGVLEGAPRPHRQRSHTTYHGAKTTLPSLRLVDAPANPDANPNRRRSPRLQASMPDQVQELLARIDAGVSEVTEETRTAAFEVLQQLHNRLARLQEPVVRDLQMLLGKLAGTAFPTVEDNQSLVGGIHQLLQRLGLRVYCPHCAEPAHLRYAKVGTAKLGAFRFEHATRQP